MTLRQYLPALLRHLSHLSLSTLHQMGQMAGVLAWAFSAKMRQRMKQNMAKCLGRDPTASELRAAAREMGKLAFETPFVWMRPSPEVFATVVQANGWELIEEARAQGQAVLAISPHLGCFEMVPIYVGHFIPATVLYRAPKLAEMEQIMRAGREREQVHLVPADMSGVRQMLKTLRQGGMSGVLPDQVPGKGEGIWSSFFGAPAYTMTLVARLSEVKNVRTLMIWCERLPHAQGYAIHISEPQEPITGTEQERVHIINRELEKLIRLRPEQYLWSYNRYKTPAGAMPPPTEAEKTIPN